MSVKKIIFILPYLNVNTTSSERFKSFIKAAEENVNLITEVITIDYGINKSYFAGLSNDEVDYYYPKNYRTIKFHPNFVQKLGFSSVNKGLKIFWRFFQFLHLLIYGTDIFYPKDMEVNLGDVKNFEGFVFCSGSHFSLFTTANNLAERLGYKLILDYRDPWTFGYNPIDGLKFVHYLKCFFGRRKEIDLLGKADLITTVSKSLSEFFPLDYIDKIKIVPNGSNFFHTGMIGNLVTSTFNIVYAGTVYNDQLNDEDLFRALKTFLKEKDSSRIKIEFLGAIGNQKLKRLIYKYGLEPITVITPRLKKDEFLVRMSQASVFIHLRYNGKRHVISSKQAEYLNFAKPILLPISDEGDLAESILENNAGYVSKSNEEFLLRLNGLWRKFENGESLKVNHPRELIAKISREKIAKNLISEILKLSPNPPSL